MDDLSYTFQRGNIKNPRLRVLAFSPVYGRYAGSGDEEGVGVFASTTPAGLTATVRAYRTTSLSTKEARKLHQPNHQLLYALTFDHLLWDPALSALFPYDLVFLPRTPDKKTADTLLGRFLDLYMGSYREGPLAAFTEQAVCTRVALELGKPAAYHKELRTLREVPIECPRPVHYVNLFKGAETGDGEIPQAIRKMMCLEIDFLLADLEGDTAGANRIETKLTSFRLDPPSYPPDFAVLKAEPGRRPGR